MVAAGARSCPPLRRWTCPTTSPGTPLKARDAADRGAEINTRTGCTDAKRDGDIWHVTLTDVETGEERQIRTRALVNAGGPWVEDVIQDKVHLNTTDRIRLLRGSRVVVTKLFE